jgi:bacterioferritin-associated ferredoxin
MIVCVCRGVSSQKIDSLIQQGIHTVEGIARQCSAGSDCGACRGHIAGMIEERTEGPCPRRHLPTVGRAA